MTTRASGHAQRHLALPAIPTIVVRRTAVVLRSPTAARDVVDWPTLDLNLVVGATEVTLGPQANGIVWTASGDHD